MATFRKRGPYQWEARIRKRGYPTTCKTFETKADAEKWAKDIETQMGQNVFVSTKESEQYTLGECLGRYIEEYIPRLKDAKRETDRARTLQRRSIAHRIMASIRAKDIADFRREREAQGVSGNTIRLDFALLSKLFNYARSDWGMENLQNPVKLAAKPKPAKGRERRLEKGEEKELLEAASPVFRPIITFALETAMRQEEIANLQWSNIDFNRRCALVVDTKNLESRTVPLSPAAIEILKNISRQKNSDKVFGVTKDFITDNMKQLRAKTQIEDLRFHDLRHTFATMALQNGVDVKTVSSMLGHYSAGFTLDTYAHVTTDAQLKAAQTIGNILSRAV